jgi:hypothetical protein
MWMIDNATPFPAERGWFLDKNGAKYWIVAVKATYDVLHDGSTTIAEKQEPPLITDEFSGEPEKSSILYSNDLAGPKAVTDVLLNGHAYAPFEKPAAQVDVELSVGSITKTLRVYGDRWWERNFLAGIFMTAPAPFLKMPINYERAFGGADVRSDDPTKHSFEPRNPIGTGCAGAAIHLEGSMVANVEYPRDRVTSWKDRPKPAGFGALSTYWLPRRKYAGSFDQKWMDERFPLWPDDFDARYFHCAPEDQQVAGFLRGGESVRLRNLTANGLLEFRLPRFYPVFTTYFRGKPFEHRAKLHTVTIEPDVPRVLTVWYTQLRVHNNADDLDVTAIREKSYIQEMR